MTDSARKAIEQIVAQMSQAQDLQRQFAPFLAEQEALAKSLQPLGHELAEAIRKQFEPINALQEHWKALVVGPPQWLQAFQEMADQLARLTSPIVKEFERQREAIQPFWDAIHKSSAECERIEGAGWLPHYTTPPELLEIEGLDAVLLDQAIGRYYQTQWAEVKEAFLRRLATYDIDDEAKQTFSVAIAMHEAGFYRGTSRLLFPEFERIARKELHAGAMYTITSQDTLREEAGNLCPSEVEPAGVYGMTLFTRLTNHLYAHTRTAADLSAIAADPVPNRHAALHGLLAYDTPKNSINMLIMADFVFQVISALKRNAAASNAAETTSAHA